MCSRPSLVLTLFCFLLLAGCVPKTVAPPPYAGRFPDQPVLALAKTPEQILPGAVARQAFSVSGGWGFQQGDAFVLSVPHGRKSGAYNNTVPLELLLIRTRNEVEFIGTPAQGKRYAIVDYGTDSRTLGVRRGRMYAVWRGQVRLLPEQEAPALYQEATGRSPSRRAAPAAMNQSKPVSREYWFDITDTFSRSNVAAR